MKNLGSVHICTKETFKRYNWYNEIPEEIRKEIEGDQKGLVVRRDYPRRWVALFNDNNPTTEEADLLFETLGRLVKEDLKDVSLSQDGSVCSYLVLRFPGINNPIPEQIREYMIPLVDECAYLSNAKLSLK